MTDHPPPSNRLRDLPVQAVSAMWRNSWTRALLIIFLAFEVYNTAILPAVRGTFDTYRARDDARSAKTEADAKSSTFTSSSQIRAHKRRQTIDAQKSASTELKTRSHDAANDSRNKRAETSPQRYNCSRLYRCCVASFFQPRFCRRFGCR